MKKMIVISGAFLSIILTGCVSTQVVSLKSSGVNDVAVYMAGTPIPEYTQYTYIEASGGIFQNKKQLLRKLRKRAAKETNVDALVNVRFGYQFLWPYVDGIAVNLKK